MLKHNKSLSAANGRAPCAMRPVWQTLCVMLGAPLLTSPAMAVNYIAYPGSTVIVTSIKGKMSGASTNRTAGIGIQINHPVRPFLGGLVAPDTSTDYGCLDAINIKTVDGWTGVKISATNILGGVTGSILNGVANYYEPNATELTRITGGIIYDTFGAATAVGDVAQDIAAKTLCAGLTVQTGMTYSTPGNPAWSNVLADVDLKAWFYVPTNLEPGTYQLEQLGVTQSPTYKLSEYLSYFPIINAGDTVEVVPPPCTISTQNSIVFDTSSEAGMKVSAPIIFTCGNLVPAPNTDAFLQARPLGTTSSGTEMNLTINSSKPGGVVRGYAGLGLSGSSATCQDNSFSLSFNDPFAVRLGTETSNAYNEIPLIWQLCRKGNETPGLATGSAILSINYK